MDYRKAYGLPERYFLSLGRMVEKKNLSTLVEAYARFARASVEKHGAGSVEHGDAAVDRTVPSLVFVGSGELEGVLREQARNLGLQVIDQTDWKAGQSGHGLTRIDTDKSERLAADRTAGSVDGRMTSAVDEGPQTQTENCKPNTENSVENDRGAVFFYGFRQIEENAVFYALAEAFVLPSLYEEWGLVVNEAMACSLPVIVSRTAGCAEDLLPGSGSMEHGAGSMEAKTSSQSPVDSGQFGGSETTDDCKLTTDGSLEERSNGFVFDPRSSDALATALARVAESEDRRLEMGKRSREIVARFSCENFAQQALRAAEAAQDKAKT